MNGNSRFKTFLTLLLIAAIMIGVCYCECKCDNGTCKKDCGKQLDKTTCSSDTTCTSKSPKMKFNLIFIVL